MAEYKNEDQVLEQLENYDGLKVWSSIGNYEELLETFKDRDVTMALKVAEPEHIETIREGLPKARIFLFE